jgi:hypothetical protein
MSGDRVLVDGNIWEIAMVAVGQDAINTNSIENYQYGIGRRWIACRPVVEITPLTSTDVAPVEPPPKPKRKVKRKPISVIERGKILHILGAIEGGTHTVYHGGESTGLSYGRVHDMLVDELQLAENDGRRPVIRELLAEYQSVKERLSANLGIAMVADKAKE